MGCVRSVVVFWLRVEFGCIGLVNSVAFGGLFWVWLLDCGVFLLGSLVLGF